MSLGTGTRLGPYQIEAPVDAGGMGEVYRAEETQLNRTVAVKVLANELSSKPGMRQRLKREEGAVDSTKLNNWRRRARTVQLSR